MKKIALSWEETQHRVAAVAARLHEAGSHVVYGVPRGGAIVAGLLHFHGFRPTLNVDEADAIVDDIIDSGSTMAKFANQLNSDGFTKPFEALVDKTMACDADVDWVIFPWEESAEKDMEDCIARILQYLGLDITNESICDTPKRVVKSWKEIYGGYDRDPKEILSRTFPPEGYDEMVILKDINFHSTCEHHMLPFSGVAHIGYIPKKRVVGLSKLARLVDCFAQRLQIQERLTHEIADAMEEHLEAVGVAVIIEATHSCMTCRGIRKPNGRMITSDLRGEMRDHAVRQEFMTLIKE